MSSTPSLDRLGTLADRALLDQFSDLLRQNHLHTASLLQHIDVIDRRQLWAKYGHPSMFDFCVARHHMSESTASKRIGAARTARRFPILFEMVGRGEIHLSGVHRLKAHLTRENHAQVLALAKHKTMRQIDQLVARLAPQPDVPTTLRALPNRTAAAPIPAGPAPTDQTLATPAPALPVAPEPALSPERGLFGSAPPAIQPTAAPLAHRRDPGRRCNATRGLEFAHIDPWAKGGDNTADNLGLRCMAHNAFEADRDYGAGFMARKRQRNQNPLKVREPLARYVFRREPRVVQNDVPHPASAGPVLGLVLEARDGSARALEHANRRSCVLLVRRGW